MKRFELGRKLPPRDATTLKTILWGCRQTKESPRIALDKLCRRLNVYDPKGRNVDRSRKSVLASLDRMQDLGVIDGFSHDQTTDILTIKKAGDWHFPVDRDPELEDKGVA